ncbi:MAG: choice-of-anchor D domain-containing protein, partial [bacterium]
MQNKGTLDLLIFSAVADPTVYTVTPPFAGIDPGEEEVFTVRFSPQAAADYPGTLTFTSNDPDEPAYVVTLLGQGVTPPDIAVSPASFAFNLNAGDSATAVMTIANSGGSALDFTIRDEESLPGTSLLSGRKLYWTETFNVLPDTIHRSDLDGTGIEKLITTQADPLGIAVDEQGGRIYWVEFVDGSIRSSRPDGSDAKVLVSNLPSPVDIALDPAGGKMYWTDFNSGTITRANLDGSGVTIIVQSLGVISKNVPGPKDGKPSAQAPVVRSDENALVLFNPWGIALDLTHGKVYWTELGGDRIGRANLDGSNVETIISTGIFGPRGIKLDVAAGKIYFIDSFNNAIKRANLDGSNVETLIQLTSSENPLDIELDLRARQFYWSDNAVHLIQRANFDGSNVTSIISEPVAPLFEGFFGVGLLSGTNWLTERPINGRIEADSTSSIELKVDTKGLLDGDYQATVFVASNDPDELEVPVPITLHVTGVPEIAVSRDTLNYGAIFIGASVIDSLVVSNVGTALLTVTDISANLPEYEAAPISFDLEPGQKQTVVVTFKPGAEQEFSGQLTITGNDPNRPSAPVALLGKGVLPPDIVVEPDSLRADLFTGQTQTQLLQISNRGRSDLSFEISFEGTGVQALK